MGGWDGISWASWLVRLAKLTNSRFSENLVSINWRAIEEKTPDTILWPPYISVLISMYTAYIYTHSKRGLGPNQSNNNKISFALPFLFFFLFTFLFFLYCCYNTTSFYLVQAGLELTILLLQPSEGRDHCCVPPNPAKLEDIFLLLPNSTWPLRNESLS